MDMFFADPSEVPLPPTEVRIRALRAEPYPDGTRVRVYLETDPFQRRPNAEVFITDREGTEVAHTSIIESMQRKMEMTLHLRGGLPGELTLHAVLFYATLPPPPEPADGAAPGPAAEPPPMDENAIERTVVDTARTSFAAVE